MDLKTLSSVVSQIFVGSSIEGNLLVGLVLEVSGNSILVVSVTIASSS